MPAEVRLPWHRQFWLVLRLLFSDYRQSAPFLAISSLLIPLGVLWLMRGNVQEPGPGAVWMLAGNAVMAVAIGSASFAIYRVGVLRLRREIDFYATLPVSRGAVVIALFALAQVSALPGLMASLLIGHWLLNIPWGSVAAAVLPALVAAVTLTVIGAALGSAARTWGHLNLFQNLVTVVVLFFSPVLAPVERLPFPLRVASHVTPTGQAAIALTDALSGRFGGRFWLVTGALLIWGALTATAGLRRLDWRAD